MNLLRFTILLWAMGFLVFQSSLFAENSKLIDLNPKQQERLRQIIGKPRPPVLSEINTASAQDIVMHWKAQLKILINEENQPGRQLTDFELWLRKEAERTPALPAQDLEEEMQDLGAIHLFLIQKFQQATDEVEKNLIASAALRILIEAQFLASKNLGNFAIQKNLGAFTIIVLGVLVALVGDSWLSHSMHDPLLGKVFGFGTCVLATSAIIWNFFSRKNRPGPFTPDLLRTLNQFFEARQLLSLFWKPTGLKIHGSDPWFMRGAKEDLSIFLSKRDFPVQPIFKGLSNCAGALEIIGRLHKPRSP